MFLVGKQDNLGFNHDLSELGLNQKSTQLFFRNIRKKYIKTNPDPLFSNLKRLILMKKFPI